MQVTGSIHIYFNNAVTNANVGVTSGVGIYTEDDYPTGFVYLSGVLIKGWDSGFSRIVEAKTYPRLQTETGGTIKITNNNDLYNQLIMADCDPKGKMIKRVLYTSSGTKTISAHAIKEVKIMPSEIELTLGSLDAPMQTDISKPISGDTYYPVILGDHDKGVFVGTGLVQEDVDTFPWDFILKNSSAVVPTVNETNRTFTFGETFDGIPQIRTGKAPSYYANTDTDRWFTVTSGGGSGSYKITSTVDDTDRVAIPFTRMPVYDIASTSYDIKTIDAEGGMTEDVTVGTIQVLSLSYKSDFFSGVTSSNLSDVINADGAIVPTNTIDKNGNIIDLGDAEINGNDIIGYSFGEMGTPTYTEIISEAASGTSTVTCVNTGTTGVIANTTDRDISTSYKEEYLCSFNINTAENVVATVTQQYSISGFFPDLYSMIYDMKVEIGKNAVLNRTVKKATVTAEYTWLEVSPYPAISSPVTIAEYEFVKPDSGSPEADKDVVVIIRNTPPHYYQNDSSTQYNNKNGAYNFSGSSSYDEARFISGSGLFETANAFAGEKKPDGVRITVEVVMAMLASGGSQAGSFTASTEVFSIGVQNNQITTEIDSNVYSQVTGRNVKTVNQTQSHLLALQDWSLMGKTQPSAGWGLDVCVSPDVTINETNTTATRAQITATKNLNTKKQLQQITWESWQPIFRDGDTTQYIGSIVDKLGATGSTQSFTHNVSCDVLSSPAFNEFNTYNTFNLQYDYDVSSDSYNSSISISNTSQSSYSADYVTGVSDVGTASLLWSNARKLYLLSNGERKLPETESKMRFIYNELDAITYLQNCMAWYGIKDNEYAQTNTIIAKHPISDLWDIADNSLIEYKIFNVTNNQFYSGVVMGKEYVVNGAEKYCLITSVIREKEPNDYVVEALTNTDTITELTTNTDTITEEI